MQRISRAPVLSATRRRVSAWITGTYLALSTISVSRQRLVRLSGRDSTTRTVSPSCASLRSSWACSVVDARTIFLYWRWRRATSMRTVIVLSGLADTTTPWRVFGRPGPCSREGGAAGAGACARAARSFSRRLARQRLRLAAVCLRRCSRSAIFCSSAIRALPPELMVDVDAALARHGQAAREVALGLAHPRGVLQLPGGVLEAQVEDLLAGVAHELDEQVVGHVVHLLRLH